MINQEHSVSFTKTKYSINNYQLNTTANIFFPITPRDWMAVKHTATLQASIISRCLIIDGSPAALVLISLQNMKGYVQPTCEKHELKLCALQIFEWDTQ